MACVYLYLSFSLCISSLYGLIHGRLNVMASTISELMGVNTSSWYFILDAPFKVIFHPMFWSPCKDQGCLTKLYIAWA